MFPLNKTACCQPNLHLGGFSIARPTAVAALEEPWCLIPCPIFGPTLGIWRKDTCVKGQLAERPTGQEGSIPLQRRKRLQIL